MSRIMIIAAALVAAHGLCAPRPAVAQCLLCGGGGGTPASPRAEVPLAVEIGSGLDFDRVTVTAPGGGSIELDPVSGSRRLRGALAGLGGMVMTGSATVHGEPGRAVLIELPGDVTLRGQGGASARISRLVTDLPPAPRLGMDGTLRFSFGGTLEVGDDANGDYRGRIAITVDYQ